MNESLNPCCVSEIPGLYFYFHLWGPQHLGMQKWMLFVSFLSEGQMGIDSSVTLDSVETFEQTDRVYYMPFKNSLATSSQMHRKGTMTDPGRPGPCLPVLQSSAQISLSPFGA